MLMKSYSERALSVRSRNVAGDSQVTKMFEHSAHQMLDPKVRNENKGPNNQGAFDL